MILGAQFGTHFRLIGRRMPHGRRHLGLGPQILLRIAVAVQTPFHLKRLCLEDDGHLADLPMARGATDTLIDVGRMIEIGKIGKVVHLPPRKGFP